MSFSMKRVPRLETRSCDIVDLKLLLTNLSFEKLCSSLATVSGIINTIRITLHIEDIDQTNHSV